MVKSSDRSNFKINFHRSAVSIGEESQCGNEEGEFFTASVLESRKLIACQTQRIKGTGNRESDID